MSRRRSALQAYLAGIIDGEGSFGIYWINGSYSARLAIQMIDPEAILLFKRLYPEGTLSQLEKNDKPMFTLTYSNNRVYEITRELVPFLIIKHRQAKIVLSYLVHKRRNPGAHGKCSDCEYFQLALASVRKEIKGKNSVNALLSHEMREYRAEREEVEQDVTNMLALLEGVETKLTLSTSYKTMSLPEQEIVHTTA